MEKLKDIDTFYSQKVIPLAFNESLSYMEQICNLISYIENTLVPAINNNANAIKELQEYVQELKKLLDKLEQKVDENFITLNTKIDTTKEELNTKIDTIKEELTTLINNVNDTLTNAINDLDSKVVEHINASNEKFNALDTSIESINTNIETINTNIDTINTNIDTINTNIGTINTEVETINTNIETINTEVETINTEVGTINTEVGTMKEQIQTIDTNVTQNTNDITNLKKNGLDWNSRKSATISFYNCKGTSQIQADFSKNLTSTYFSLTYLSTYTIKFNSFNDNTNPPEIHIDTNFTKRDFPQQGGIAIFKDTTDNKYYICPYTINEFNPTITLKINCQDLKGNTNILNLIYVSDLMVFNR